MAGRGRGRGGHSFREINEKLGGSSGGPGAPIEPPSELVLEPPPLFPPLENKPVSLDLGVEGEYLLALKRDFIEHFHDSPAHLQDIVIRSDIQRYSDRYKPETLALRMTGNLVRDWSLLPKELQEQGGRSLKRKRKLKPTKDKTKVPKKIEDITSRLEELEKKEEESSDVEGEVDKGGEVEKEENKDADSEAGEEVEDEDQDEEMDDGTDYINNYFDNGEDYIDEEDDNLDDGPTY